MVVEEPTLDEPLPQPSPSGLKAAGSATEREIDVAAGETEADFEDSMEDATVSVTVMVLVQMVVTVVLSVTGGGTATLFKCDQEIASVVVQARRDRSYDYPGAWKKNMGAAGTVFLLDTVETQAHMTASVRPSDKIWQAPN
ncbi:hypothetical protein CERZMDRAFT_94323 [Cercospora zeae-maydis SCOH1-5]|uniref:Uncharacterized protein n=1 Tax=Cercospora zeae-maydis SCOH1-5 TaxID=717836 RepID=A0A6A6FR30_9PEZI|nr:hypothetical protein CERZMDRAFT_94323 [Cercospora zeae-maydis SCOH1-5]